MTTKPHIVIYSAIHADYGGVERNLIQLVTHLSESYQFSLLCPATEAFQVAIQSAGANWQTIHVPRAFSPSAIRALVRRLKRELKADLIQTIDPRGSTIGCPAGKFAGVPVIHNHNVSPLDYENNTLFHKTFYPIGEAILGWRLLGASI